MRLDNKAQQDNLLQCIHTTASTLKIDASDTALGVHVELVRLRRDVEAASIGVDTGDPQPAPEEAQAAPQS